jgi:hypothetical protein
MGCRTPTPDTHIGIAIRKRAPIKAVSWWFLRKKQQTPPDAIETETMVRLGSFAEDLLHAGTETNNQSYPTRTQERVPERVPGRVPETSPVAHHIG